MVDKTVNAAPRTILLKGRGIRYEAIADATIIPGSLLQLATTGDVLVHAVAGGPSARLFALENELIGNGIDDSYNANDYVQAEFCWPGMWVLGYVAAGYSGPTIQTGVMLWSAGDGSLTAAATVEAKASVVQPGAANGSITWTAVSGGAAGNDITIIVSAPSGAGSVTVVGNQITIVPAAASDTATAVVAQVAASTPAAALVGGVAGGSGAGAPTGGTYQLAGGTDSGGGPTGRLAMAMGTPSTSQNTNGVTVQRVQVVVV